MKEFAIRLQQGMRDEQARGSAVSLQMSPQSGESSPSTGVHTATPILATAKSRKRPQTPQNVLRSGKMSKVDELTASLSKSGAIELSPTGFVHFPRHCEDDDNWERLAKNSKPSPGEDCKTDGKDDGNKSMSRDSSAEWELGRVG